MSTTPDVVITREPTGNVIAEGGDELAVTLLKRAGFVIETTPLSFWYRLPWDMGEERENQMASHAARMLTAVGYRVELDPGLDVTRITTPTDPLGARVYGQQILSLTDQLNGTETYAGAADVIEHVVDPDDGVVVRLGQFFEAAAVRPTSPTPMTAGTCPTSSRTPLPRSPLSPRICAAPVTRCRGSNRPGSGAGRKASPPTTRRPRAPAPGPRPRRPRSPPSRRPTRPGRAGLADRSPTAPSNSPAHRHNRQEPTRDHQSHSPPRRHP